MTNNKRLVSIVIPLFNRETLVGKTITSVLNQTYTQWECIIVDDHSTDNGWEILESFSQKDNRIKIFKRDRLPKGAPTCRNIGIEKAKGEYIMFLDSDDLLEDFCLNQRIRLIKSELKKLNVYLENKELSRNQALKAFSCLNLPWNIMSVLWKKELLLDIKGFDENFELLQDPELHLKALTSIDDFDYACHNIKKLDTNYTNSKVSKALLSPSHAVKLLRSVEKFIEKFSLENHSILKRIYMNMVLEFYQRHKTKELYSFVIKNERDIKKSYSSLTISYYTKFPRIKGASRLIDIYERNIFKGKV